MNDRGGVISERQKEIQTLAAKGARVEIRGAVCMSTCTMFLGSPELCISPNTRFGFHGPSDHGRPLTARQFDYWSKIIASYYPKTLARWYLSTARHRTNGYFNLSGKQLIRMGIPAC